jgi:hypothetical protein
MEPVNSAIAEERETAQWYTLNGASDDVLAVVAILPVATKKLCYRFGLLVSWQLLPADVKLQLRRRYQAVRSTWGV